MGYQGWRYSPTIDEPAHLAAGLAHWTTGDFTLYRVNPPLIRMLASAPLFLGGWHWSWVSPQNGADSRPEFASGTAFCWESGSKIFWYVTLARWACLPITVLGGLICYRWALELYGPRPGLFALALWCFCPNILGNSTLITSDSGAAAFGVGASYVFWRWLQGPSWRRAALAGFALGLADLAKTTWIVLFGLWPLLALLSLVRDRLRQGHHDPGRTPARALFRDDRIVQLPLILVLGIYVVNLGYGFGGSFRKVGDYRFTSSMLRGAEGSRHPANRFADSWLALLPVPVPADFLLGIDQQWHEFEKPQLCYLAGELKYGGWWYYYLYALSVKVPTGTLCLGALACAGVVASVTRRAIARLSGHRGSQKRREPQNRVGNTSADSFDEFVVLAPALVVLTLVSSKTGINTGVRYVLPAFPFLYVWLSRLLRTGTDGADCGHKSPTFGCDPAGAVIRRTRCVVSRVSALLLVWSSASALCVYPHCLSYFNELSGGPENGPRHLLDSNIDWGQDLLELKRWYDEHSEARPFHLAYFGPIDPRTAAIEFAPVPRAFAPTSSRSSASGEPDSSAGWHAVSVNGIYGYRLNGPEGKSYTWLQTFRPVARAGYSILIYHVTKDDAHHGLQLND